jgi:hypothetical protein
LALIHGYVLNYPARRIEMKRSIIFALILTLFCGMSAFARGGGPGGLTAAGVYGSFGSTGVGGIGASLKFGSFPVLGIKYNFSDNGYLGVSADYYVLDAYGLVDSLSCFVGLGLYGGLYFGDNTDSSFDFGGRIPIGLQLWVIKKLELYLAAVPIIPLYPTITVGLGGELGLRVHF